MNGATRRSHRLLVLITLAVVGLAAGCGGGDDKASDTSATTATTAPGPATEPDAVTTVPGVSPADAPGGPACAGLRKVADLDQRSKTLLVENVDWETVKNFLLTESPKALEGYGEAARNAPSDVRGDITTLQDFTGQSLEAARQSTSLTDFAAKAADLPGAADAGAAGQRLDSYARATCGFGVSN
jgi:hypothetical protein